MNRNVAFRVDAGVEIGTGHVMRCVALANTLSQAGIRCHFITRAHRGNLNAVIKREGHDLWQLPMGAGGRYGAHPAKPMHSDWLGTAWLEDAAETLALIERISPDAVILDHYAIDLHWERRALPAHIPLVVIDDLADRPHRAQLLVDQNIGRSPADYIGLLPEECQVLSGPRYALLRPEFAAIRPAALARRKKAKLANLLITLGGADKHNATMSILKALAKISLPTNMRVFVVIGMSNPWLETIEAQVKRMPHPTEVLVGVSDMAGLIARMDLCIGAVGSSAWERCVLGLPTLAIVLARNQEKTASLLAAAGVHVLLPPVSDSGFVSALSQNLGSLTNPDHYRELAFASARQTRGNGCKIVSEILQSQVFLN